MKLSVMVITYNHEQFLAQALNSILSQRVNFDYEIVVGEDCSTDRTREILMDFCRRYPDRISPIIRDHNVGMMRNLDETLSACHGQYVAIIEGDDYWTCVDKLQNQVDFLDAHPDYALCCHRVRVLDEIQENSIPGKTPGLSSISPSREAGTYKIEDLLAENFVMSCSAMYRNGTVGTLPKWFFDMKVGDWALYSLAARSGPIFLMDEVMAVYRVHAGGVWSSQTLMGRLLASAQMFTALDRHLGFRYHVIVRQKLALFYLCAARLARGSGDRRQTALLLFQCLRYGGWHKLEYRPEIRDLADFVFLGSWQGMSITTQLVQSLLRRAGYKLVRIDNSPAPQTPQASQPLAYGLDTFFSLLRQFNFTPRHILDIGANRGLWTRKALRYFPEAQYTLVEPQDNLKSYIQDLLDAGSKITWINAGASDDPGVLPLNISYRDDSSTFVAQDSGNPCPQVMVPVMTVNEIMRASEFGVPDICKIDAEGFDLKVLAGASDLIGKTEIFFVEVTICSPFYDNTIARVVQCMDEAGYRVIDITDINRSTKYGVLWLCELAFLKKGSSLLESAKTFE